MPNLVLDNSKQTVNTKPMHTGYSINFMRFFRDFLIRDVLKKVIIFLSFLFFSTIPAFAACTIQATPSTLSPDVDTPVQVTVHETGTVTKDYLFTNLLNGTFFTDIGSTPSWCTGTYSLLHPDTLYCDNVNPTGDTYVWNIHMNIRDTQQLGAAMGFGSDPATDPRDVCTTTLTVSPTPTPGCSVTVSPSSIPANTNTSITVTTTDVHDYVSDVAISFFDPITSLYNSPWIVSYTTPSWADTSNCNIMYNSSCFPKNISYTTFPEDLVVNFPSDRRVIMDLATDNGAVQCTAPLHVNQPPTVGSISVSPNPVQVNTATIASANFTDPDTTSTHTASWNWGDGNTTTGTITESNGSGSVSDSHTYSAAGVYTITLTVTNTTDGLTGTQTFQYVSVYNPTSQGLFSAARKYTSPAGAYTANTSLTGTVLFGLSYKYQGSVPVSNKEFSMDFNAANFHFNATTVNSLVIANGMGTLTGTGTVNGSGTYNFLVTGSESNNTIRIQIKDSSGNVVYDTQPGAADTATPTTSVTGQVLAH